MKSVNWRWFAIPTVHGGNESDQHVQLVSRRVHHAGSPQLQTQGQWLGSIHEVKMSLWVMERQMTRTRKYILIEFGSASLTDAAVLRAQRSPDLCRMCTEVNQLVDKVSSGVIESYHASHTEMLCVELFSYHEVLDRFLQLDLIGRLGDESGIQRHGAEEVVGTDQKEDRKCEISVGVARSSWKCTIALVRYARRETCKDAIYLEPVSSATCIRPKRDSPQ